MEHAGTDPRRVKILVGFILIFKRREEGRASAVRARTLSGDAVLRFPANACKGANPWQKLRH